MKAVIIDKITKGEEIVLSETSIPEVRPGWLLIKVKGFGLNHSEKLLRLSEICEEYINNPVIPGIECVGEVVDTSDCDFKVGDKVVALMGGMGRSFNGSYAEYALLPAHIVFKVKTELKWESLAAVPETYFTAWGSLFECLHLSKDDCLLVRGASSALGYAAIQIAKALGAKVIATTHKESKLSLISEADEAILDDGKLKGKIKCVNKALDLVGPLSIRDTLTSVDKGAIVCDTGILGGVYALDDFDPIKEIPNGVYLTGFFSNYPTQETIDEIFDFLSLHNLEPKYGKVFDFENIKDAIIAQDNASVNGKIVVRV